MDRLEEYAQEKDQEKNILITGVLQSFRIGSLSERGLEVGLHEVYRLGHHAGHCRGENYKRKLDDECESKESLPHSKLSG